MPKIIRQSPEPTDEAYLSRLVDEYVKAKEFSDAAVKRTEEMKKELSNIVDIDGYTDHIGHKWIEVASGVQLKRERRVSINLDHSAAQDWAQANDLWEEISIPVRMLDEDALATVAVERPELQVEIQGLYKEKETWAFKVIEPKQ